MSIATHIIDITGGTVHTVDTLLAAAVPSGASLVTSLNAQLGSTVWQGGGSGTPAWGSIVGTLSLQTDLAAALSGKAASSHTHTLSQITDVTVTSNMVSIPKGIRPGLYDDLGTPPVGTIFEGVNDGPDELDGIVRLLSGKYALMNMIPFNSVPDLPYQRPSWERAAEIARTLHRRGILTKLRQSAGQDVDGGCGQLRARDVVQRVRIVRSPVTSPLADEAV